jgi:hypothetical protein
VNQVIQRFLTGDRRLNIVRNQEITANNLNGVAPRDAIETVWLPGHHPDIVPSFKKFGDQATANVSGAPGNKNLHGRTLWPLAEKHIPIR